MTTDSSEIDYYKMNFKSIFYDRKTAFEIESISNKAVKNREQQKLCFDNRLSSYHQQFENGNYSISPKLEKWDKELLTFYQKKYGGLLCALFHFGSHRHFFVDTSSLNIQTVAPIAGKSYYDIKNLISTNAPQLANNVELLEVENDSVSLKLIKSLKAGKIAGIYVDGNMGPGAKINKDNCIKVNFFDFEIGVKPGIARLSTILRLPILPIFCKKNESGNEAIYFKKIIEPANKKTRAEKEKNVMQLLYRQLENEIKLSPSEWEFALCMHRWRLSPQVKVKVSDSKEDSLSLSKERISIIRKGKSTYWVNILTARGIKIPLELNSLFTKILEERKIDISNFNKATEKFGYTPESLLKQLEVNGFISKNLSGVT